MSSTNKTSLGLNMWEASDKPVRQDFVNDNVIIDEKITKLNSDLKDQIATINSNLPFPIFVKDPLSINLDSELFKTNKLYFHAIAADKSSNIKGFPQNAYGYGALITGKISNSYQDSWGNFQIYIPHNGSNNSEFPIYIRTSGDGSGSGAFSWRRIDAKTTVMANT